MADIDVIIPCYRYAHFLTECVNSVLTQAEQDVRILIIDDTSPDNTAEVASELAREDRRVEWLRHPTNRGHIATYNEGLEWASADYALLLSADDWVLPGAFSRAVRLLDSHPEVGFVFGPALQVRTDGERQPELDAPPQPGWTILSGSEYLRSNYYSNPVETCTAMVRTALQKRIGGYRPELPHSGDMEMWMRFAVHGSVGRLNAYQGVYRQHAHNMSVDYYNNALSDLRQRKLAYDVLFDQFGAQIAEQDCIRTYLESGLAKMAVHAASPSFNRGDTRRFEEILAFAADLDPGVRRSAIWRFQSMKRRMGPRLWRLLRPTARRLFAGWSSAQAWARVT